MSSEINVKQVVPFLRVSDIEESLAYYVYGLDFEVHNKWLEDGKLHWCWLTIGGGALMLQQFSKEGPDAWTPAGKLGDGVSIYFICEDEPAIYRYATARGLPTTKPLSAMGCGSRRWRTRMATRSSTRARRKSWKRASTRKSSHSYSEKLTIRLNLESSFLKPKASRPSPDCHASQSRWLAMTKHSAPAGTAKLRS